MFFRLLVSSREQRIVRCNFFRTSNSSAPIGKTATLHVVALRFAPIVNQGVG
jgi:hypothetical protein